jgi:hypothetical protein
MRLAAPSTVVTSVVAIALAIAAPAALARADLNPSPSQITTAHLVVRPNHSQQAPPAAAANAGPRSEVVDGGGYGSPTAVPATAVDVIAPNGGFDWGDAGIGAAAALALTLLCIGGALAVSQRRARRSSRSAAVAS